MTGPVIRPNPTGARAARPYQVDAIDSCLEVGMTGPVIRWNVRMYTTNPLALRKVPLGRGYV